MLKRLAIFAKWPLAIALGVGAIVFVTYEEHKASDTYKRACESQMSTVSPPGNNNNADSQHDCQDPKKYMPWGYVLIAWPDGITVWALLATLCALVYQSNETRKAANATLGSVRVQEAGMGQWIDVEPLGCYIQTPPAGQRDFPFTINLRFEAVNNTAYTLDIQKIVTKIGMLAYEWEVFTVETNVTLASQEKSRNRRYAFYIPTQSVTQEWFRRGTVVTINGEVTFKNCLGRTQTDYFGGLYRCGQINSKQEGIFRYLEALGIVPERTKEKDQPY